MTPPGAMTALGTRLPGPPELLHMHAPVDMLQKVLHALEGRGGVSPGGHWQPIRRVHITQREVHGQNFVENHIGPRRRRPLLIENSHLRSISHVFRFVIIESRYFDPNCSLHFRRPPSCPICAFVAL